MNTHPGFAILITHGTDTLAWTHAAVRYAVKHNKVNIAITGSQIPMPDGVGDFSDAYANIGNSIRFLTQFKPPHIFTVFNNGQNAFSDSLYKINRWDNQAFEGDLIGTMQWDEVKFHDDEVVETLETPESLDTLYVVTTGGTIESTFNGEGVLSPQQNRLSEFIKSKFDNPDTRIIYVPACTIDSSDLTFEKMRAVINKVKECFDNMSLSDAEVDLDFDENVRILYTDPFKTEAQYRKEMEGASAVILAGYGGGNINIDDGSGFSPLQLIREKSKEMPILLTSQVALGPADFIYENAWEAVKAGAISGVDLSIPEIQIRLAYLMGHRRQIESYCQTHGKTFMEVVEWLFLSGMKFRTHRSRRKYEELRGVAFDKRDLLIDYTMEESLHVFQEFTETPADNEMDVEKILELATEYYDNGHKEKGFALYKKAAELGSAQAQHFVANCYRFGLATTKDENEAVHWYRKAADQDYLQSIYALAEFHMWGSYGVEKSTEKAVQLWHKAAETGDVIAQHSLGNLYLEGLYVEQNREEAIKWYRKAAQQGYKPSRKKLLALGVEEDI
jgi:L-asparaginase/Glu-tRNA(Gln) amidotransferase subunit D